ncbi:hypothetical protein WICPIJ_003185, partial [Wickerhamomyces pijperi]
IGGKQIIELVPHSAVAGKEDSGFKASDFKTGDIVKLDRYGASSNAKKLKGSSKKQDTAEAQELAVNV